ncbi:hypothetical protein Aduo_016697 [Ancylostoma duodenale]
MQEVSAAQTYAHDLGISTRGYHKAQLTKAGNELRGRMVEIDSTIMERVVLTGNPGTDIEAVHDRKRCVLFTSATIDRAVSLLKSRWEAAQEFARENPDEHGELPFLDAIQDHWDANGLDRAMEEAETLLVRLEVAIKLLPTPEAMPTSAFSLSGSKFHSPNAPAFEQPLKLPAFELPEFNGEIDAFPQFWDLFATAVHNNTSVPVTLKFMYLKTYVKGTAANLISNFQPTAQNYEDAGTWSQMKHVTENPSAIGTLKLIRSKFPSRTRERVGELKSKGDSLWTVDELLTALDKVIDQLEGRGAPVGVWAIIGLLLLGTCAILHRLIGTCAIQHLLVGTVATPLCPLGITATHVLQVPDPIIPHVDLQGNTIAVLESLTVTSVYVKDIRRKRVQKCRPLENVSRTSANIDFAGCVLRKVTGEELVEPLHVITVAVSIIARSVLTVRVRPEIVINLIPAIKAALPQDAQTTAVDLANFHHAIRPSSLAFPIPQVQVRLRISPVPTSRHAMESPHPRRVDFSSHPRNPMRTNQACTCTLPHEPTSNRELDRRKGDLH